MTATRTRRSGEQTRAALVDAAYREFAEYGIAGARIDRIAAAAHASKERLYTYFGDKDGLLLEVLERMCHRMAAAVEIDGNDLAGYAADLTGYFLSHPEDLALCTWARLEPSAAGSAIDLVDQSTTKLRITVVRRAQLAGVVDNTFDAATLLQLITAIAAYWADDTYRARPTTKHEQTQVRQRARIAAARLVTPQCQEG